LSVSADRARRLREILIELRPELPGDWTVRGRGLRRRLVQEPVEWTVVWISYGGSVRGPDGWFYAGVMPLVLPTPSFTVEYGMRMDGVPYTPQSVDLLADNAVAVARQFFERAVPVITDWPAKRLADVAERSYVRRAEATTTHWHELAGWRVVFGTASPVQPAAELAELYDAEAHRFKKVDEQLRRGAQYYRDLGAVYQAEGQSGALAFLEQHRLAMLAETHLDKVAR
jgi:hypothetical protein